VTPMSVDWVVEPLTVRADLDAVLAIEQASFTSPWTREMYLAEFDNVGVSHFYLVKTPLGEVVGFCSFWRILDELHINNLAVAPAHRRARAATMLLGRVLADGARMGATRATLEVRRSNAPAQRLYEQFDFAVAGIRRAYYSNPVEDALVLWKEGLSALASPGGVW
jgi:ribosomal-protein-alanine N-acetyltransferase